MNEDGAIVPEATVGQVLGTDSKPRVVKISKSLQHDFSMDELNELGRKLAELFEKKVEVDAELKEVKSEFKSKIDNLDSQMARTSHSRRCKYEYRDTECEVQYHEPEVGMLRIVRLDTMQEVEVKKMSEGECQGILPLEDVAPQGSEE